MRLGRPLTLLLLALAATFWQQTFAALGRILPPVIAPAIVEELRLDPALVGVYVGVAAAAALVFQMGCGSFILRYGALRMSQAALVMLTIGLSLAAGGTLALFALSAVIAGGGAAISTPASSHLLGRYSPPRYAPLVFSIKQTAVPMGLLLAGLLGPFMTGLWGWRGALLAAAAASLVVAVLLEPLRAEFDADRVRSRSFRLSDFATTLGSVVGTHDLRGLSLACFAFNGLQTVFTSYFVIYLVALDYTLAAAGLVFSVATLVAIPGRVLWGWLGSVLVPPRRMLALLALGMAGSAGLMALFTPGWPTVAIGAVATLLSMTALSWHGVLLSETARLAPEGMRGAVTGGVLSFGQIGALLMPLLYAALLGATGGHGLGFLVSGLPALLVGIDLLRPVEARRRPG
ncbi:MFS transporter [Caldovatus sediminis]|uniref:MFS transporter n=1 Tax=Caldovatus sediminis TaxID=2041189 RepID=A0A8J2Z800_9PROT|nr:MFS transporter [Caldovatus sediminis]GGG19131.1 MFS transporter [Caldovatus sediminis]